MPETGTETGLTSFRTADERYEELRTTWARGMISALELMLRDVKRGAAEDCLDDSALVNDTLVNDLATIKGEMEHRQTIVDVIRAHCTRHRRGGEV